MRWSMDNSKLKPNIRDGHALYSRPAIADRGFEMNLQRSRAYTQLLIFHLPPFYHDPPTGCPLLIGQTMCGEGVLLVTMCVGKGFSL